MPTTLAINKKKIELVPLDDGSEIWAGIEIERAHRDSEGTFIGLRKSLLDAALKRKVKFLNIKVKDLGFEFDVSPEEFVAKAKIKEMPSKYGFKPFLMCLFPISELILKKQYERKKKN